MPDTDPNSPRVLALFAELLDADRAEVDRCLATEPPEVRDEVLALLSIDGDAPAIEPDEMAWALALDLRGSPPPTPVRPEDPPGYDLHELIGRGGMGEVYRAIQHAPRREVAIKFVSHGALAEAQALADANLSIVPSVYQVGEHQGRGFLSMERVQGEPLLQWARGQGTDERLVLLEALCRGVHRMHERGVVHRDLKPGNILVSEGAVPRLLDFGLAFNLSEGVRGSAGTLAYMADETLEGEPATVRSDVFALACIVVEVMTGSPAMPDATLPSQQRRARLGWTPPSLGPSLDHVVRRGLAAHDARYPDANALANDLRRIREGSLPAGTPLSTGDRLGHLWRTHRRRAVPAVVLAVVLVAGLLGWLAARDTVERHANDLLQGLLQRLPDEPRSALVELDGFLTLPAVQGTAAADRARLIAAERHHALGDSQGERRALAAVYADGRGVLRDRAATLLAERFREERSWPSLDAILPSVPDPLLRDELEVAAAVGLRAWDRPAARQIPLFDALRHATRSAVEASRWRSAAGRFGAFDLNSFTWGDATAPLEARGTLALPPRQLGGPGWMVDFQGPLVVAPSGDRRTLRLLRPRPEGWASIATVDLPGRVWSVEAGDPNQDGVPTLFVGTAPDRRTLRALEPPRWTPRVVAPDLDAIASDIEQVLIADLDRDGRDEILVHAGAWNAHDLRVYRQGADGTLALVDRVRLGGLARATVLDLPSGERRIAVVKVDRYPNPTLFGDAHPYGEPAGLYVFALRQGRLERLYSKPIPGVTLHGQDIYSGDFDDDGAPDLVAHTEYGAVLIPLDAGARVRGLHFVRGLEVLGTANLDDDDADELVARIDSDPHLWVLGSGDSALPSLAEVRSADEGPLERLGLYREAAERRMTLAALTQDPQQAATAYTRAASLFVASGAHRAALEAIGEAVALAPTDARYEAEAALLATLARYDRMRTVPPEHRRGPQGPIDTVELDFTRPLPDLRWERPTALRHTREGLSIQASSGDGLLFSLPVERTADVVALEAELSLSHVEGGAKLTVALVGPEGIELAVGADPWGGSRQVNRKTHCLVKELVNDLGHPEGFYRSLDRDTHHRLRVAVDEDGVLCLLERGDDAELYRVPTDTPLPRRMTLEVRMSGFEPAAHLRGYLEHIRLLGVRPLTPVVDRSARALVTGAIREALPGLVDPLARVEVLGRMGRTAEAREVWASADHDDEAALLAALRRQPEVWLDLLAVTEPERLAQRIARGWTVAYGSGASADVDRMLLRPDVDRLPAEEPGVVGFLLAHARLLTEADRPERALQLFQRLEALDDRRARVDAALGAASAALRLGDEAAAREACERARRVPGRPPFLLEDRIGADPDLHRVCRSSEDSHPPGDNR